jgi:arylsulfatase A
MKQFFILLLSLLQLAAAERPNLIIILADDLGFNDVSFNGRKTWSTPNLDRLASQGTTFKRWYTAGVVCAPSRAALMTGKYTIHDHVTLNNADLPRAEVTLPEALKPLGYTSALFGKWHHGATRPGETNYVHPMDHGFDEFMGYTDARHAWEHFPTNLWFGRERRPVQGYSATLITDRAIQFLKQQQENNKPFFLYQAYIEPHLHVEAPEGDLAKFRGKFEETKTDAPRNAHYAAMITRLDKEIGRLLKTLDDLGLSKNTLVVFSSDHGATFEAGNQGAAAYHDSNYPFRGHKRTLWEGGVRVPGIVRWPGEVPPKKISNEIVHMTDVFPSLLAAASGKPDASWEVDGKNVLDVWRGKSPAPERTLFWEWRTEGSYQLAAMRGDMKLVVTGRDVFERISQGGIAGAELFNVVKDPAERRNLAPGNPEIAASLRKELLAWLATEKEPVKEPESAPDRTAPPRRRNRPQ